MGGNGDTFKENIKRVESLIALYDKIKDEELSDRNKEYRFTDMLRTAVVFMHSAFETYYRSVIIEELKKGGNEKTLKDFPLLNGAGKESTKFTISDLAIYKDKTVMEILNESIELKLGRTSFNKYADICQWAEEINIKLDAFSKASDIEKAIQRRHKIVHEADMHEENGKLSSIYPGIIIPWEEAYIELVNVIETEIKTKGSTDNVPPNP